MTVDADGTTYVGGREFPGNDGWTIGTVSVFPPGADVNTPAIGEISINNPPMVPGCPTLAKKRAFTLVGPPPPRNDGRVIEIIARILGGAPVDATGIVILQGQPRPIGPLGPRTEHETLVHDMIIGLTIEHLASYALDTIRAEAIRAAARHLVNAKANEMIETPP